MPSNTKQAKKRVVVSYVNLSPELKELLKTRYPHGFENNMIRVDKGQGEFFYGVVLETEDTSYFVKLAVKIDDPSDDDDDKEYYDDDIKGADDIATDDDDDE